MNPVTAWKERNQSNNWYVVLWKMVSKKWELYLQKTGSVPFRLFILDVFQLSLVHIPCPTLLITAHTRHHSHPLTWWSHKPCCKCLPNLADCSQQRQPVLNSPCSLPWVPSDPSTPLCSALLLSLTIVSRSLPLSSSFPFRPVHYCWRVICTECYRSYYWNPTLILPD